MIGSGPSYDSALTLFSPDGRLFQVEYALEAVSKGTTVVGIRCKDGVVLAAIIRLIPLQERTSNGKLFKIDEAVGALVSGLSADSRHLMTHARTLAQVHFMTFGEPIPIQTLTKKFCDYVQTYTQQGGIRPFGVQVLFAGVDKEPQLFVTDPIGSFWSYKAYSLGQKATQVIEILEQEYRSTMTVKEGLLLAAKALNQTADSKLTPESLDFAKITEKEKRFIRLDSKAILKLMDQS
ncbi:MAG: archaeal proteasome endopeptidase complex subunit alpha [Promethearchaeota archaeon]